MKKILLLLAFLAFSLNSFAQATAYQVDEIAHCSYEIFDLTVQTPLTLGNQPAAQFTVTYYLSQSDAENGTNAIATPQAFIIGGYEKNIWIRVENNADGSYDTTSFLITMQLNISVPEFEDVATCSAYTLPYIEWPALYYTGPDMSGNQIANGTVITDSQTIYIHAVSGVCNAESSFTVTITGEGPYIFPPNPLVECTQENYATFNIQPIIDGIDGIGGITGVTIHETFYDAENGANPIANPSAYVNITAFFQTVYIRAVSDNCITILPLQLIAFDCEEQTGNSFSGRVSFDSNEDGCDYSDEPAAGVWVSLIHDNSIYYAYTDNNGNYMFNNVPDGTSYVNVEPIAGFNTSPEDMTVVFPGNDPINNDFCVTAAEPVQDIMVYMYPVGFAVPGFEATYVVMVVNPGSVTVSGDITITYDASNLTFIPTAGITQSGNTLTISYSDLSGFQTQYFMFSGTLAAPPALSIGDVITFTAVANPIAGDVYPENNTYILDQQIVNSYDPNDITCKQGDFITEEQAEGYLHYTVRFQNTGTFQATNVRIESMLDANLDWDTFEPITASHDFQAYRNGNNIQFLFEDINLPDNTSNEAASHGYVIYKVKPKATVQVGDSMSAQAGIYFDFNTPVITNTAVTTITTMGTEVYNQQLFSAYPNPATGSVNIKLQDAASASIKITNVLGKTVLTSQMNGTESTLDIAALSSGVYFITLQAGSTQSTQKIIVK
jgi:uncharacterized repeat protein (TIGR01451 family)